MPSLHLHRFTRQQRRRVLGPAPTQHVDFLLDGDGVLHVDIRLQSQDMAVEPLGRQKHRQIVVRQAAVE